MGWEILGTKVVLVEKKSTKILFLHFMSLATFQNCRVFVGVLHNINIVLLFTEEFVKKPSVVHILPLKFDRPKIFAILHFSCTTT